MSDLLLDKYSVRDLVMVNPFRVLQLPVDATGPVIRKHQQKLRFDLNQSDWKGPKPMCWAMSPPPTGSQIQEAFSKLDDPVERFLAELFWYWPNASGEFTFGLGAWGNWPSQENGGAGPHNIALFHLFSAVQKTEALVLEGSPETGREDLGDWKEALSCWNRLLNKEEAVWQRLRARILEIGDPRLETDLIPTLRLTLIPSIEGIAINQLERAFAARNQEKWSTLLKSALTHQGVTVLSHPRQLVAIPTKELDRADQMIKSALARIEPVTEASKAAIQQWIVEVKAIGSMLWVLEEEAGLSSEISQEVRHARNDVLRKYINSLRSVFIEYHNETLDRATCLAWLNLINGWDIGGVEGGRVKEDIERLTKMQSEAEEYNALLASVGSDTCVTVDIANEGGYTFWTVCACCLGDANGNSKTWTTSTQGGGYRITRNLSFPICKACEAHHNQFQVARGRAIGTILAAVAVITFFMGLAVSDPAAGLIGGFLIGGGLFLFARNKQWPIWAFRAPALGEAHAHRGHPIEIVSITNFCTTIRFMNPIYGQTFAEMNKRPVNGPFKFSKYPRGSNLMTGKSGLQIGAWSTIGAAVIGWACCGMAYSSQNRASVIPAAVEERAPARSTTDSIPNAGSPYSPSGSNSYTPSPSYATSPVYTSPTPNYGRVAEKARIESMKSELRMLEIGLESKKSELESLESQIQSARNSANLYASTGPEYLYNSEVDRHNSLLRRYESLRQDFNSEVSIYQMRLRTVNAAIDAYNRGN